MPTHRAINHAFREIRIKTRSKMIAEIDRHQVEISPLEHKVMVEIAEQQSLAQRQLVDLMNRDKAQVTRMVSRLVRQDLVSKSEHPEDKRAVELNLTDKGHKLLTRLNQVELELVEGMLKGFSQQEAETFKTMLERVDSNLS